jgi:hypothetical protein
MGQNQNNKKGLSDWIIICGLAALPWIFFSFYFTSQKISHDINDWSDFGSYIGGSVAALTVPFSLYLLIKTYQTQKQSELTASQTLENQKFERRLFELIGVFNEYRYNHLRGWIQQGDKKEEYYGFKFFTVRRRSFQIDFENNKLQFDKAFNHTIEIANLNFEFYFRCLENILTTIEDIDNDEDRTKFLELLSNLLTNDEKFFVKYFDTYTNFSCFKRLHKYKSDLVSDLYIDYKKTNNGFG